MNAERRCRLRVYRCSSLNSSILAWIFWNKLGIVLILKGFDYCIPSYLSLKVVQIDELSRPVAIM